MGKPVNGTDIIPAFDHSVEILGDKAILVYPQSTGEAGMGTPDEGQGKKYRQVRLNPYRLAYMTARSMVQSEQAIELLAGRRAGTWRKHNAAAKKPLQKRVQAPIKQLAAA